MIIFSEIPFMTPAKTGCGISLTISPMRKTPIRIWKKPASMEQINARVIIRGILVDGSVAVREEICESLSRKMSMPAKIPEEIGLGPRNC